MHCCCKVHVHVATHGLTHVNVGKEAEGMCTAAATQSAAAVVAAAGILLKSMLLRHMCISHHMH
jgi:hypothetical protein